MPRQMASVGSARARAACDQRDLEGVASVVHLVERRMRRRAVALRVHVLATCEHQTGHPLESSVRVGGVENREDEWQQPRAADGHGVRGVDPHAEGASDDLGGRGDGDGRERVHGVSRGCEGTSASCILSAARPLPQPTRRLRASPMFDHFRQSLRDLMDRSTPPEERRAGLAQMKQTLVHARMGLDDLRGGISADTPAPRRRAARARDRAAAEGAGRRESTITETVALAEKYEALHAERTAVLARKLSAQEAELAMVEREVAEMTAALKGAISGVRWAPRRRSPSEQAEVDEMLDGGANVAQEIDALGRASAPLGARGRSGPPARGAQATNGEVGRRVRNSLLLRATALAAVPMLSRGRAGPRAAARAIGTAGGARASGSRSTRSSIYAEAPSVASLRRVPVVARLARTMHETTQLDLIERFLLFKSGDRCSELRRVGIGAHPARAAVHRRRRRLHRPERGRHRRRRGTDERRSVDRARWERARPRANGVRPCCWATRTSAGQGVYVVRPDGAAATGSATASRGA